MAVAKDLGIEVPPELVMQVEGSASTPELGFPITNDLLRRTRDFTAIVAFNDLAAIGAIRALREHGLAVPEDVSVVGFDDFEYAAYNAPSLTTIRQPLHKMGNMAARLLLERIRGENGVEKEVAIVPELVIRESTAPPPARRKNR
jgi:LacI family transcriptional regulator